MKKNQAVLLLISFLSLQACYKKPAAETTCDEIKRAKITHNSPVTVGDSAGFSTHDISGARVFEWNGPNHFTSQSPKNSIYSAELKNEGWYYMSVFSADGSCIKADSFYLDIKLPQGTPACSIASNSTTYNNQGTETYTSVTKLIDPTFSLKTLMCYGPGAQLAVNFHPRWRTAEPEDGIYTTINTPLFDQTDDNYNKVFVTATKNNIYWASREQQNVYVSHVGSKLQIRFCSLSMGGNNGQSYTSIASGNLLEK